MKLFATSLLLIASLSLSGQTELPSRNLLALKDSMFLDIQNRDKQVIENLVGNKFPTFDLQTISRDTLSNIYLEGKPTVIQVWDLYCQPCLDQMELLNLLKRKYENRLNFISITRHPRHEVFRFLAQDKFDFTHLVDAEEFIQDELDLITIPKIILLDAENIVREVIGINQLRTCCGDQDSPSQMTYIDNQISQILNN